MCWTKVTKSKFDLGSSKLDGMARMQSYKLSGFAEKNISNKNNYIYIYKQISEMLRNFLLYPNIFSQSSVMLTKILKSLSLLKMQMMK